MVFVRSFVWSLCHADGLFCSSSASSMHSRHGLSVYWYVSSSLRHVMHWNLSWFDDGFGVGAH